MKQKLISILVILIIWFIYSLFINNPYIDFNIIDIIHTFINICNINTLLIIIYSFTKVIIVVVIAMILAIIFSLISNNNKTIDNYISPMINLLSSIPNICFILFLMVILKRSYVSIIIVLLICFPVAYQQLYLLLRKQNNLYEMLLKAYPLSFKLKVSKFDWPLIKDNIIPVLCNVLGFGIKVGIMSEVIVYDNKGIGYALNLARTNLDLDTIFVWTIIILLILYLINKLLIYIDNSYKNKKDT